jgi:hypothetical protein
MPESVWPLEANALRHVRNLLGVVPLALLVVWLVAPLPAKASR